jgi:hypothetical protein
MSKRLRFVLLAVLAAMATMAYAGTAAAGDNGSAAPDPQTTNVPYLAWAGNQVNVTKCFDSGAAGGDIAQIPVPTLIGKFVIEDWSGVELSGPSAGFASKEPQFLNDADGDVVGQIPTSGPHRGSLCFSVHVSSLKPGMAVIKLAVREDLLRQLPGLDVLAKHQFLVIWMQSNAPTIREVANADFPSISVGDPTGNGIFDLGQPFGANRGLVEIDVTGTVPMGNNFWGIFPGNSVTLPNDWLALAQRFSFDDDDAAGGVPGSAVHRWDIHDDQLTTTNHAGANPCTPKAGTIDAVDNCTGGPAGANETNDAANTWEFSHIYGLTSPGYLGLHTLGPFDPLRPSQSFLPDGKTDAGDAPGPPLRIDVRIGPGGVGGLEAADKDDIYVRNSAVPDATAHNLYAPFYQALIPANVPGEIGHTSGVAGSFTNNFPGFQTDYYDYWSLLGGEVTDPLRNRNLCLDELGRPRTSPTGYDHVAVYTDEHFEAFVAFNPATGFNFAVDSNGRCDLDLAVNRSFTSQITASSVYPDQPVIWDQANKTSNTLTKRVNIAASKTLSCVPKGQFEMFCVETIRDIFGRPVVGARVQFTRSPQGLIQPDAALHGGFDTRTQGYDAAASSENRVVVITGTNGQAGVLVTETRDICVDVLAENLGTRISVQNPGVRRQVFINPARGTTLTACGDGTGGGGPTTPTQPTQPTTQPTTPLPSNTTTVVITAPAAQAAIVSLGGNPTPVATAPAKATPKAKAAAARLSSAQLLTIKGNRYLVLKLKSKLNSAKVRITLIGKNGKAQRVVIRKVATNRAVVVPNLKLGKSVRSVRVSVI